MNPARSSSFAPVDERLVPLAGRATRFGTGFARYALVVVLLLIGLSKFTPGEAAAIMPLVSHSPLMSWMYAVASPQAVSDFFGTAELIVVALLLLRPVAPRATAVGAGLAVLTFLSTLSFLLTTPGAFAFHGLAVLGDVGAFLIKDLALLAASIIVLGEALAASERSAAVTR